MTCFKYKSSTDHYEIDEKLFPYLSIEQKGYGGLTNKGKKCPNLNQCSSNTIGSCLIITLTVLVQSAPFFMFYLYDEHQNDNWRYITNMTEHLMYQPNTKVDIPPTLPGKYLAMELLKANEKFLSKDLRKLLKPNYLEYFIGLIGYSSESVRDNEKILFANSTNSSNVLSTEHLHKSFSNYFQGRREPFYVFYKNLFPEYPEPLSVLYSKKDNIISRCRDLTMQDDTKFSFSLFTLYERLNLWSLSLSQEREVESKEMFRIKPTNQKMNPINLLEHFPREALPNIISFQLPYWIIVNPFWSKVFSQSEKKSSPIFQIHPSYYLKLLEVITNFNSTDYELNENMIMRKLSTITIGQRNIQTGFDENSRLENLPIFSKTMGDDEPYDVTGIIYALYSSRKNLDIRQSLSDEFNPEERQMENIQSCRKEIMENFSEVKDLITDETFKMKLDEIYPLVESIIKKLMEAYCAHVLGYYKVPSENNPLPGHVVTLYRSLDNGGWFHVTNDLVAPIKSIKQIIYAHRQEMLKYYQLSMTSKHKIYVEKWNIIKEDFQHGDN